MADELLAEAKAMYEAAYAEEEQLSLLDPPTPEEMAWAQAELGPEAGRLTVLQHARNGRKGRKPGSRNKRTDDFARLIQAHGRDPALVLAEIMNTPAEVLVERSRQLDPVKRQLSYGDANALRIRCAENLMPFTHSKKPIAIDATIRGVVVKEQIGEIRPVAGVVVDQEPLGTLALADDDDDVGDRA